MNTALNYTKEDILYVITDAFGLHDDRFNELPNHEQEEVLNNRDGFLAGLNQWLEDGKGLAVYENHDLGHPELGHRRFFSFGAPDAQFLEEPPSRLPDFPTEINWRYVLVGTYRGEVV